MIVILLIISGVAAVGLVYYYGLVKYLDEELLDLLRKRDTDAKIITSLRTLLDTRDLRLTSALRDLEGLRTRMLVTETPEFLKTRTA